MCESLECVRALFEGWTVVQSLTYVVRRTSYRTYCTYDTTTAADDERRTSNFERPSTPQTTPVHPPNFHTTHFKQFATPRFLFAGNCFRQNMSDFSGLLPFWNARRCSENARRCSGMVWNHSETSGNVRKCPKIRKWS